MRIKSLSAALLILAVGCEHKNKKSESATPPPDPASNTASKVGGMSWFLTCPISCATTA
jgi:hypothetical protein